MRIKSNSFGGIIRHTSWIHVVGIKGFVLQTINGCGCRQWQEYVIRVVCLSRAIPSHRGFLSIDTKSHARYRLTFQANVARGHFQAAPTRMIWYATISGLSVWHSTHVTLTFSALHSTNKVIHEVLTPERSVFPTAVIPLQHDLIRLG